MSSSSVFFFEKPNSCTDERLTDLLLLLPRPLLVGADRDVVVDHGHHR